MTLQYQKRFDSKFLFLKNNKIKGDKFATCSSDHTVKIWNYNEISKGGKLLTRFDCPIYSVAFSACDNLIACGSSDGNIKIINIIDSSQLVRFKAHEGQVKCIVFDPKQKYLASSGSDGKINIWDYSNQNKLIKSISILPHVGIEYVFQYFFLK